MKKVIASLLLFSLVLILIVGCSKEANLPLDKNVTPDKIKVNVIVSNNVSNDVIEDLKKKGLEISGETDDYIIVTGNVNKTVFDELKNTSQIKVVVKKEGNGQISAKEDEQAYERLRAENNITVGPYIYPEVWDYLKNNEFVPIHISFRVDLSPEVYQNYREVIISELKDNFKLGGIHEGVGISFWGNITKNGLEELTENPNILFIRKTDISTIPSCTVFENGTKVCTK